MSLTYTTYIASIANLMPTAASDPYFAIMVPNMIDDAEQRIYRELDFLLTQVVDSSGSLTAGNRAFTLPTSIGTYVVTDRINVITPSGTTVPNNGTRNPLTPASREMIDYMFPAANYSGVPLYYAPTNQLNIIVGPFPDQAYTVEVGGTQRPRPISTTNVTTILSVYFPDLLIAASMVFAAAYQKNFGAAVDDPKAGVTWEGHFQDLLKSAHVEEQRKKFTSQGWSAKEPAPLATPPRT